MENDWVYYTIVPDILILCFALIVFIAIEIKTTNRNNKKRK